MRSGPALTGLSGQWSADQLISHLKDPDTRLKANPRLAYRAEKYAIGTPKVSDKSPGYAGKVRDENLEALVEYKLVDIQVKETPHSGFIRNRCRFSESRDVWVAGWEDDVSDLALT